MTWQACKTRKTPCQVPQSCRGSTVEVVNKDDPNWGCNLPIHVQWWNKCCGLPQEAAARGHSQLRQQRYCPVQNPESPVQSCEAARRSKEHLKGKFSNASSGIPDFGQLTNEDFIPAASFVRECSQALGPNPLKEIDIRDIADRLIHASTKLSHASLLECGGRLLDETNLVATTAVGALADSLHGAQVVAWSAR